MTSTPSFPNLSSAICHRNTISPFVREDYKPPLLIANSDVFEHTADVPVDDRLPVHKITLKNGCPIMLLRNFDPANGHCNRRGYTVTELNSHVIEAVIATGPHTDKLLCIPRIPLMPSDNQFPFQLRRRQFPLKSAFPFTANKSQGQTLDRVGVFLPSRMFTRGQLI
ncbi:uncharacterized protein LOC115215804 [Octopus sinensis]|uniref:Uncharacterized protein LOC115215804 n=1 Tax=Octopus sinensis TaxID=2607531 RepID=A0A6P7SRP7_9MOLL|nr:uncharacterized protein LOC115215804 [Octopus sinensis]